MPQNRCCVSSCGSLLLEGAVLHCFPNPLTNPERFQTWVTNAGLVGENEEYIFKNRRICRRHFEEIYHYPGNRMNRLAIPTLYIPGYHPIPLESISTHKFYNDSFTKLLKQ